MGGEKEDAENVVEVGIFAMASAMTVSCIAEHVSVLVLSTISLSLTLHYPRYLRSSHLGRLCLC